MHTRNKKKFRLLQKDKSSNVFQQIKVLLLEVMSSKGFHPAIIHSSSEMILQCQAIKQSNERLEIGKSKLYLEFATKTRSPTRNSTTPKSFSQCNKCKIKISGHQ